MKNYVPFEDYPDGGKAADTVTVESDTTEQKRREEEKGEKENKVLLQFKNRYMTSKKKSNIILR